MNCMKKNKKYLSLIIPAYKQEKTIKKDLLRMKRTLDSFTKKYEIIVVVDGFVDKTFQIVKHMRLKNIHAVGYKNNYGKGYAVRFGMAKAKGDIIAFLDSGMDLHPKSMEVMLTIMHATNADIVIGSKLHPKSKIRYPWQRKIMSWGYRSIVHFLFGLTIRDTQVGIKVFRRKVLQDVLPRLIVKRYAFDIEMLAVAYYLGYRNIHEAPITLTFNAWSSITSKNFWRAIYLMLWDTAAVYYRLRILKYYDNKSKRRWRFDEDLNFRVNLP